jgi:hypothetical protein
MVQRIARVNPVVPPNHRTLIMRVQVVAVKVSRIVVFSQVVARVKDSSGATIPSDLIHSLLLALPAKVQAQLQLYHPILDQTPDNN